LVGEEDGNRLKKKGPRRSSKEKTFLSIRNENRIGQFKKAVDLFTSFWGWGEYPKGELKTELLEKVTRGRKKRKRLETV